MKPAAASHTRHLCSLLRARFVTALLLLAWLWSVTRLAVLFHGQNLLVVVPAPVGMTGSGTGSSTATTTVVLPGEPPTAEAELWLRNEILGYREGEAPQPPPVGRKAALRVRPGA